MKNKAHHRNIHGILLLDKPIGITSNAALQLVKSLYAAQKAGHTGSLDPLASGMLPICFGEATKFAQFLLESNKSYQVTAKLGITTKSGDAEGEVLAQLPINNVTLQQIEQTLKKFQGEIDQIPSMYSAIKHQGQPLYKLARQGITVERQPRRITIYVLKLLAWQNDELKLEIHCSKGTYVRTLIEDIGKDLSCGAHVIALRRLTVEPYQTTQLINMTTLEQFAVDKNLTALDTLLLPIESMLATWQEVKLSEATAFYLYQGQAVFAPHSTTTKLVKLINKNGKFLGVGEILADGRIAPLKLINYRLING